jgi:hypothetical protein
VIPYTSRTGQVWVDNDARVLIDILRHGPALRVHAVGPSLTSGIATAELLDQVGNRAGAGYVRLLVAMLYTGLGDSASARQNLARGEACGADDIPQLPAVAALARVVVAVEENDEDAPDRIEAAMALCRNDAMASFALDCLLCQWRIGRGEDVRDDLHQLRERALAESRTDWLSMTELLSFEAEPTEDDETRCRDLIRRHKRHLTDAAQARLLALAAERLAVRGQHGRARVVFAEAESAIAGTAAGFAESLTREAFQLRASAPLRRALAASGDDVVPLFLSDTPPGQAAPRKTFTAATLCLGTAMFLVTAGALVADAGGDPLDAETADRVVAGLVTAWIMSLLTVMFAVVRRERPYARLFLGWLLGTLALLLSIAGGLHHLELHNGPALRDNPTRAAALGSADPRSGPSTRLPAASPGVFPPVARSFILSSLRRWAGPPLPPEQKPA